MILRLGISPCPNDTFAFHGIMERKVDLRGLEFEIELRDVQQLNDGLASGRFDVAKASFHAAMLMADRFGVLPAGAALGFGVGPLLVAGKPDRRLFNDSRILCPGPTTTATLLFRALHPNVREIDHAVFSEIGPALVRSDFDFGVLIHEGRLTFERDGLFLVEDLGTSFERLADAPIPLGGILARLDLPPDVPARVTAALRDSIAYGWANRAEALTTIRKYAQELDEAVIWPYVELYVNDHTVDLGEDGARALRILAERAGLTPVRILE